MTTILCRSIRFGLPLLLLALAAPARAQLRPIVKINQYRASFTGVDEFQCLSVSGIGLEIERAPKRIPPVVTRVHRLKIIRRFTTDRTLHQWIDETRKGMLNARNGRIRMVDSTGKTIVTFEILGALPKSWSVELPRLDGKEVITETIVLHVRDININY